MLLGSTPIKNLILLLGSGGTGRTRLRRGLGIYTSTLIHGLNGEGFLRGHDQSFSSIRGKVD